MPKTTNYPQAAFKSCLEVANAVDELGGTCSIDTCAQRLNKQSTSGAYRILISATVKFGLVHNNRGTLNITPEYRLLKHAYTEDERLDVQRKCFLKPDVFSSLYQRFIGKTLPVNMLDKLMIRELGVEENVAARVAGYFVKGLRDLNLIDGAGLVLDIAGTNTTTETNDLEIENVKINTNALSLLPVMPTTSLSQHVFTVSITGPGVNNTFQIEEEEDLEWVEVAIRKIKRALKTDKKNSEENE